MKIGRPLSEEFLQAAESWVALDSAARLLEEGKSAFLSQRMMQSGEKTMAKAEMVVKASDDWADYIKRMNRSRTAANLAKVKVDFIKMRFSEQQSDAATERAAARL